MPNDNLPQLSDEATEAFHKLTPKQQRFVIEYQRSGNASHAYRTAYNCSNMAPATIINNAYMQLRHSGIAAILTSAKEVALSMAEEEAPKAIQRLVMLADVDPEASAARLSVARAANTDLLEVAGLTGKGSQINVNVGIDQRAIELWQTGGAAAWRDAARSNDDG